MTAEQGGAGGVAVTQPHHRKPTRDIIVRLCFGPPEFDQPTQPTNNSLDKTKEKLSQHLSNLNTNLPGRLVI